MNVLKSLRLFISYMNSIIVFVMIILIVIIIVIFITKYINANFVFLFNHTIIFFETRNLISTKSRSLTILLIFLYFQDVFLNGFEWLIWHSTIWPNWPGWVLIYKLSSFYPVAWMSRNSCFEQGVLWHSGNYRVWIHSETRTWHDDNIQLKHLLSLF